MLFMFTFLTVFWAELCFGFWWSDDD